MSGIIGAVTCRCESRHAVEPSDQAELRPAHLLMSASDRGEYVRVDRRKTQANDDDDDSEHDYSRETVEISFGER